MVPVGATNRYQRSGDSRASFCGPGGPLVPVRATNRYQRGIGTGWFHEPVLKARNARVLRRFFAEIWADRRNASGLQTTNTQAKCCRRARRLPSSSPCAPPPSSSPCAPPPSSSSCTPPPRPPLLVAVRAVSVTVRAHRRRPSPPLQYRLSISFLLCL